MDINEFKSRIKEGRLAGCYIFAGEEDYLKKHYASELAEAALTDDSLEAFNHLVYSGAEIDLAALLDAVSAPPMMSDYKLIEWKYPVLDKMKQSDQDTFEMLLDRMDEGGYTVLSFIVADGAVDLGTPKRPSKFVKRFDKRVGILRLDKSTDAQLLSWLKRHFDAEGIKVSPDTLKALIFRSGHNMTVLDNEVKKLSFYARAKGLSEISETEVSAVASSTAESDTFALSNAVLNRNKRAAFLALDDLKGQRTDPVVIMAMLSRTCSELATVSMMLKDGMNPADIGSAVNMGDFKLKMYLRAAKGWGNERATRVLEELSRMDTALKFGGISGYTAIEIFIAKCL